MLTIKFTDIIPVGPWAQEEMVQERSNPAISGYEMPSPCHSTAPLYQQVLTPQVPTETEMGTWLAKLLTGSAESSRKAGFIHPLCTTSVSTRVSQISLEQIKVTLFTTFVFVSLNIQIPDFTMNDHLFCWLFQCCVKKLDLPLVYKLILLNGSTQGPELFILLLLVRVSLR